jgi:hypothetical protein
MTSIRQYLARALEIGDAHPFVVGCRLAGIEPGIREIARWRDGRGVALQAAWKRWPKSKSLPRLADKRRSRTSRQVTRAIRAEARP